MTHWHFRCGLDAWKAAHHEWHQHQWAIQYWPDKIITPLPPLRLKLHTKRPLRNMDLTCKMVKGQVNAINFFFLTVMAMQESLTYPHSLSPCNVMGFNDSFVWFFFSVVAPQWHLERYKRSANWRDKKKKNTFNVHFKVQLKQNTVMCQTAAVHIQQIVLHKKKTHTHTHTFVTLGFVSPPS